MKLYFTSGSDAMTVSTNNYNHICDLSDAIVNAIKTVYTANNRKSHNALEVSVGDCRILIGFNMNGGGRYEWYNPSEKVGGCLTYGGNTRYCESVAVSIWSLIYKFFGLPWSNKDLENLNAAEEEAEREEIANTCAIEAGNLAEDTERLYYKARTISEKIGTHLHYSDPDDDYVPVVNMAMEMREILYQIKRLREDFLDRADGLTGCNCCLEDFMGCDDMIVDGFDLKYSDPDDIFESLWHEAWNSFDGVPCQTNVYNAVLYGFVA